MSITLSNYFIPLLLLILLLVFITRSLRSLCLAKLEMNLKHEAVYD